MAKTVDQYFDDLQQTRVWRSIFRSGAGSSTLKRALAIQQNVFLHLFSTKVRTRMLSFSATWYLGTLTLGTFLILVATGIPLMLYYHPSAPQAYADTKDLQFVVSSGMFLRNLHRWSAHAMVFLVFAHMFKVFYRGAYRTPREFNWVIGVVLLLITLLLSYTGYLLPWDQLAYWAITVGSNIASAVPVIGDKIHFLLLGGHAVNANALLALLRAALHDPAADGDVLRRDSLLAHSQRRRTLQPRQRTGNGTRKERWSEFREGGEIAMADSKDFVAGVDSNAKKSPRRIVFITRRTSAQVKAETEDQLQTFPEVLFRAAVAIMTLAIALVWIALIFNAPLEGLADPSHTPNPAKAPWYFLGLQEMLHYFPPVVAGVLVPGLVVMALIVIPYFKVNIEADGLFLKDRQRRLQIFYVVASALSLFLLFFKVYAALVPTLIMAGIMLVAAQSSPQSPSAFRRYLAGRPLSYWVMTWFLFELVVLTAIGTFFRGPGWAWVWPWQG